MQKKSIYKYASESGLPMGLYLTMMSACLLLSIKIPILPMFLLPLGLCLPVVLWSLMKKIVREEPSYSKFSSLWLGGIYTIIFGSMICMFLSALYIVTIEPGFVHHYVSNAIEAAETTPIADQYANTIELMREAIDAHILPSGLEFLSTMAWLTCFIGSMLSLVIALIMSRSSKNIARFPA